MISRIIFAVPHPETFARGKTIEQTPQRYFAAIQERLYDLVNILAFGSVHLLALFASTDYFANYVAGYIVPKNAFWTWL